MAHSRWTLPGWTPSSATRALARASSFRGGWACATPLALSSSPLHTCLDQQRALLRQTNTQVLNWTPQAEQEFEKARLTLSHPSSLHPFDPKKNVGILTDVAKTIGMGIILFQFDPAFPPCPKTNFEVMGVWSICAKPSWRDLSPLETEILGFHQAYQKLSYYITGAPKI